MPPNPMTLKQRLAALAVSASNGNGTREDVPRSPASKRRTFFTPPFVSKRSSNESPSGSFHGEDRIQEVMSKFIFQAGVDYETRPMVVMNASALPDPQEVSYDLLLARILAYLNLYVEADYTVVFFAAGGRHTPGWNWVWKAYRSLSRKYRKNLKRLFIVHSNFFTKMLFSLAGAIISPKFFRKITYVDTLSELAYHVPLTQIDIPPAVYQENTKFEKQINLPVATRADLFGVPLEELMGYDGEKGGIPRVVRDCIQYLRETGMQEEGLFRRSPSSVLLKQAQQAYDRGHVVSLHTFGDPHLAAVLLKKYLRDLPEPLFPERLYPTVRRCPAPTNNATDMASVMYIRETILPELPPCAYVLLNEILHLLHEVSLRSATNRMDAHNLAVVITPNLVKGSNPIKDVMMCSIPGGPSLYATPPSESRTAAPTEGKTTLGLIIKLCIQRYYEIFDEVPDRTEAHPYGAHADTQPSPSFSSSQLHLARKRDSMIDDDEDIDDAMLVMPLGPSHSGTRTSGPVSTPSAWNAMTARTSGSANPAPYQARQRPPQSKDKSPYATRSVYTAGANGNSNGYSTVGRAKSMISIENGAANGGASRKGTITVGRGTLKKSSGSGVEAMGITAGGFFTPPASVPPVPALPGTKGI